MSARYTLNSGGDIGLTAGVAKTVLLIRLTSAELLNLIEIGISFDGQVATNEPVLCELFASDGTTDGTPGSTPGTFQSGGPARAFVGEGEIAFTAEPTVLDIAKSFKLRPDGGLVILQAPLGREFQQFRLSGTGLGLRITAPEAVNFTGWLEVEQG